MRLHFPSVAVGVAAVSILLVSMSQATAPAGPPRIEYGPHPRDMIQVKEGVPFTVPPGRLFVLTGLGRAVDGPCSLLVDGQQEVAGNTLVSGGGGGFELNPCTVAAVPLGFTVPSGSTISLNSGGTNGRAWGYLANQ